MSAVVETGDRNRWRAIDLTLCLRKRSKRFANFPLISVASPVTVREDVDLSQTLHIPQSEPGNHGRECSVSGIGSCDLLR